MRAAFDDFVMQVGRIAPALFEKLTIQTVRVFEDVSPFLVTAIQPDTRMNLQLGCPQKIQDTAMIPPDGGRMNGNASEDLRIFERKIKRYQSAQG